MVDNIIKYKFEDVNSKCFSVITTPKCGTKFFDSQPCIIEKRKFNSSISFKNHIKGEDVYIVWRDPLEQLQKAVWTEFGMCDTFDEIYDKIINEECFHFSRWTYKTIWFSIMGIKYYTYHLKDITNLFFAPNIIWAMVRTTKTKKLNKKDIKKYNQLRKLALEDRKWLIKILKGSIDNHKKEKSLI